MSIERKKLLARILLLGMIGSSTLTGCKKNNTSDEMVKDIPEKHLAVMFGDQTYIFKDVEDYSIRWNTHGTAALSVYVSDENGNLIAHFTTTSYSTYDVSEITQSLEDEMIENGAKVFDPHDFVISDSSKLIK